MHFGLECGKLRQDRAPRRGPVDKPLAGGDALAALGQLSNVSIGALSIQHV
jgi:hypothetical protein